MPEPRQFVNGSNLAWSFYLLLSVAGLVTAQAYGEGPDNAKTHRGAAAELRQLLVNTEQLWLEGDLTCELEGIRGKYRVRCGWVGDEVRREYAKLDEPGPLRWQWTIHSQGKKFMFNRASLAGTILPSRRSSDAYAPALVRPQERWMNVTGQQTYVTLLDRHAAQGTLNVSKTHDGFLASIRAAAPDVGYDLTFNHLGLPLYTVGVNVPRDQMEFRASVQWRKKGSTYLPLRMTHERRKPGDEQFTNVLNVTVEKYAMKVDRGLRIEVPPPELPLGARISDRHKLVGTATKYYVGGEEGENHFYLHHGRDPANKDGR